MPRQKNRADACSEKVAAKPICQKMASNVKYFSSNQRKPTERKKKQFQNQNGVGEKKIIALLFFFENKQMWLTPFARLFHLVVVHWVF